MSSPKEGPIDHSAPSLDLAAQQTVADQTTAIVQHNAAPEAGIDDAVDRLGEAVERAHISDGFPQRRQAEILAFLRLTAHVEEFEVTTRSIDKDYFRTLRNEIKHRGVDGVTVEELIASRNGLDALLREFRSRSGIDVLGEEMTLDDAVLYFHEALAQLQEICYAHEQEEDGDEGHPAATRDDYPPPPTFEELGVALEKIKKTIFEDKKKDYQAMKRFRQLYCFQEQNVTVDGVAVDPVIIQRLCAIVEADDPRARRDLPNRDVLETSVRVNPDFIYQEEKIRQDPNRIENEVLRRIANWKAFYHRILNEDIGQIRPYFRARGVVIQTIGLQTIGGFFHVLSDSLKVRHLGRRDQSVLGKIQYTKSIMRKYPGLIQLIMMYYNRHPGFFRDHHNTNQYFYRPIHEQAIQMLLQTIQTPPKPFNQH